MFIVSCELWPKSRECDSTFDELLLFYLFIYYFCPPPAFCVHGTHVELLRLTCWEPHVVDTTINILFYVVTEFMWKNFGKIYLVENVNSVFNPNVTINVWNIIVVVIGCGYVAVNYAVCVRSAYIIWLCWASARVVMTTTISAPLSDRVVYQHCNAFALCYCIIIDIIWILLCCVECYFVGSPPRNRNSIIFIFIICINATQLLSRMMWPTDYHRPVNAMNSHRSHIRTKHWQVLSPMKYSGWMCVQLFSFDPRGHVVHGCHGYLIIVYTLNDWIYEEIVGCWIIRYSTKWF